MQPSRNINYVSSTAGENHLMFLRQLSSSGSSFLPRSRPPFCRAGFRGRRDLSSSSYLPHFSSAPPPWWRWRGFPPPPPPPGPPRFHPAAHRGFSGTTFLPRSFHHPGNFGGGWQPFSTSARLMMERPDRDREPPYKRRKSSEERRSATEHKGGAAGGSKRGHHQMEFSSDSRPRPNHHHKDGREKNVSRENSSDKDAGRTKSWTKDRQRRDDETRHRAETHQQGGRKDSQSANFKTQTSRSKPEQDKVHMNRPNAWFKDRAAEQRDLKPAAAAAEGQFRDRSTDGGTSAPPNPWQVAGANGEPPPPGTGLPVKPGKSLQRHWEDSPSCSVDVPPPWASRQFDFSVMSYNILSQELLQDNVYLYRHCPPSVLPWDHRLPNLLAEIQHYNADILCLQEVQQDHYENQIKPALQALGYQCEYKKRTGSKPDGCAVIFKTSRLSLLSSNPVEYFRRGDALLDRDNVGQVLLLQPNDAAAPADPSDPSSFICVANTHLLYNPRRGDIKLAQLAILLAEINRLSRLPDGSTNPVVVCGDFNSTPWSPLYSFLTTGRLEYKGMQSSMVSGQESVPRGQRLLTAPLWSHSLGINHQCQYEKKPAAESCSSPTEKAISNLTVEDLATKAAVTFYRARLEHGLKLLSSYQHHLKSDGRPEITTCHSRTAMTVDYILYTPELVSPPSLPGGRGLQLLGRLSLVGQSELEEVDGLPNRLHSSDHLPLLARFRLRR
ncbi:protein angel homolog 2 isoform X2 [Centropristis striata]|uniref:protein angel homolog 2 isoform X2 n=1 Tax=Centropristis striata TaxID=184440 RepID=UPI0027E0AB34|nr:protein angel homolog 2 isoform X2 [Centropristis striata]